MGRIGVVYAPYPAIALRNRVSNFPMSLPHLLKILLGRSVICMLILQASREKSSSFCSGKWSLILIKAPHYETFSKKEIRMPIKRGNGMSADKYPPQIS